MNRLKEKSERDLAALLICCVVVCPCILLLIKHGQGISLIALLIILTAGLAVSLSAVVKEFHFHETLDEREKNVYIKSMLFSMSVFATFWFIFTFSVLLLVGGKGTVLAGILPLALMGSALITQTSQTVFLNIYFRREAAEDTEGGPA